MTADKDRDSVESALVQRYGSRTVLWLGDFVEFGEEIADVVVAEGRDRFFSSRALQLAAEALLQKLGEAANRLPEQFRQDHDVIPWRAIRGMRNVLSHEYHAVDYGIVWETAAHDLPAVVDQVRRILGR